MADVKDLDVERKKRAKAEKMGTSELHYNIALKMMGSPLAPRAWTKFPHSFHIFQDRVGKQAVLEETAPGLVAYRDELYVTNAILKYCYKELASVPGAALSHRQAMACKSLWTGLVPAAAVSPSPLAEKSTPGLAFHRLPFDAPPEFPKAEPVRFEEFLSRCSQPEALCAFIGSLFFPDADRQQYLYLYGEGNDGKGSLLRMLFSLLGSSAAALQPKGKDDRFWNMKVYGKRLVMFPDCDDMKFFSGPDFKSLTGNDPIYFEEKGRMGFSDIPTCKIIAASNHKPNITSQRSDLRRLIFVEVKPVSEGSLLPNYDRMMLDEAETIVRTCKASYLRACPENGTIACFTANEVAFEAEGDYLGLFDKYFEAADPELEFVPGSDFRRVMIREGIKSPHEQRKVKEIWSRQFGFIGRHTNRGTIYRGFRKRALVYGVE